MTVSEALEKLEAIMQTNASKHLLNYGELRELTNAQNELLIEICEKLGIRQKSETT